MNFIFLQIPYTYINYHSHTMSHLAPHLQEDEEQILSEDITKLSKSRIGPQGKSKYGK